VCGRLCGWLSKNWRERSHQSPADLLAWVMGTVCRKPDDYRAGSETLARKLAESGTDAWQLLEWLREPARGALAAGQQVQLLARVFAEQFEFQVGHAVPAPKEKIVVAASGTPASRKRLRRRPRASNPNQSNPVPARDEQRRRPTRGARTRGDCGGSSCAGGAPETAAPTGGGPLTRQPGEDQPDPRYGEQRDDPAPAQTATGFRPCANPHEPEATYAVKAGASTKRSMWATRYRWPRRVAKRSWRRASRPAISSRAW